MTCSSRLRALIQGSSGQDLIEYALLAGLIATGTIGFAAVGTLFAAMLVRAQSRDVLLPVLLYPIVVPVIRLVIASRDLGAEVRDPDPIKNETHEAREPKATASK